MRVFKKSVAFILMNILVAGALTLALKNPYELELQAQQFRLGNYNAVVLGQSSSAVGIDPEYLSNDDEKVYNISRGGMSFPNIYYILKDVDRNQSVKKVYLNIDYGYWMHLMDNFDIVGGETSNNLYLMKQELKQGESPEYIWDVLKNQELFNVIFDYRLNGSSIHNIPHMIETKLLGLHKEPETEEEAMLLFRQLGYDRGGIYEYRTGGFKYGAKRTWKDVSEFSTGEILTTQPQMKKVLDKQLIEPKVLEAFEKIVSYCKKNNIELTCFALPLPPKELWNENYGDVHAYFTELCRQNEIDFYDLNYIKFAYFSRSCEDYVDAGGHLMGEKAQEISKLLGKIILSENPEAYFWTDYQEVLEDIKAFAEKAD